ncbi:MAG: protocatechuate 3,4-dioxygenase subunit alpha [Terracidiphilus sp.]
MSDNSARIPSSSQTVGPYFGIGLEYLVNRNPVPSIVPTAVIEIRGRVLDRDGLPVSDAMLEFWNDVGARRLLDQKAAESSIPDGFRRVVTDEKGEFALTIARPAGETTSAAHFLVLVFARGLLRHLISRVYLGDEVRNKSDAVLLRVPPDRRATLIGRADEEHPELYWWDVVLQGTNETVFFAW